MKKIINKIFILIFIFLITIILSKKNVNIKNYISNKILNNNISFYKLKTIYNNYFGKVIPFDFNYATPVFNENIEYNNITIKDNMIELEVSNNYLVPAIAPGIVIFKGSKNNIDNLVIVEGDVTIWYSNIDSNIKLYDVIEKGDYIGNTLDNKLNLIFEKEGKIANYKDYI